MRILTVLLTALLVAPLATAQSMDIASTHQVRIAYGDIPSTATEEPGGQWNVQQLLLLPEGGNSTVTVPDGHFLDAITCRDDCGFDASPDDSTWTITCAAPATDGQCVVATTHWVDGPLDAFGMSLPVADDHTALVYIPEGLVVSSRTENLLGDGFHYPGSDPALLIHQYHADGGRFWFTVSPQTTVTDTAAPWFAWPSLLIGAVVGAAIWYVLVRQGIAQRRQRRQVAGEAAHKQVAASEDKAALEWRRRALMAAMKELEMGRMQQEIDLDAYDALKADFKRQTVTVMRALEELGD